MTRWEFKALQIPHRDGTYSPNIHIHPQDLETWCNKMGAEGWDFCETNTGSILLFKREIEDRDGEKAVIERIEAMLFSIWERLSVLSARADPPA